MENVQFVETRRYSLVETTVATPVKVADGALVPSRNFLFLYSPYDAHSSDDFYRRSWLDGSFIIIITHATRRFPQNSTTGACKVTSRRRPCLLDVDLIFQN